MTQTLDHSNLPSWQAPPPPPPPPVKKRHVLRTLVIVGVVCFAGMGACIAAVGSAANKVQQDQINREAPVPTDNAPASGSPASTPTTATPKASRKGVTLAQFNQIQTGMTYAQVSQILGSGGTEDSHSEIAGYVTTMYSWQGASFASNMNAMFQNGKLISKAQFGLK